MPETNETGWVKKIGLKLKTFFISKDVLSFLLFLALSTTFWFVHTLDRERKNSFKIKINYTGIPEDIQIQNKLVTEIDVTVQDEGKKILQYLNDNSTPLNIDLTRVYFSKGKIVISPDQLKAKISNYFLPTTAVLKIEPDSLVIVYQKLASKELPIKLSNDIQLKKQYKLSDSIRIEPAKVKVMGPKHILDTMRAVYIEKIDLTNISDTTQIECKLAPRKNVKYAFNEVNVGVFVEMFTENKTTLPITIINNPENLSVRLFPSNVNIAYNIGLSDYKKINPNDIKIVFDYNDVINTQKRKNKLRIINNSPFISNIRIEPNEVEFLIEKTKLK